MTIQYLSITEAAERVGVTRVNLAKRKDLPEPDAQLGSQRGWLPETIDRWWGTANHSPGRPAQPEK